MPDPDMPSGEASRQPSRIMTVVPLGLLLVTFGAVVRLFSGPLTNPDTYFHLRFGHEFLTDWSLRHPGSVSTFATARWVPTQWAPEVAMAKFEDWFGLSGVAWLAGLMVLTYALALFLACRRRASVVIAVTVTIIALVASSTGLSARPQVISYILVVVTTSAWLRTAVDGKSRWWLIPLTWVWAICHGMWPVGIIIGIAAVVGLALDGRRRNELARFAAVPVLSAVAAALTPAGPRLYSAVLLVGSRAHYFAEWSPPDFKTGPALVLAAMLAVLLLVRLRGGRMPWPELSLAGLTIVWALYSSRTVPVGAAMAAPLLAMALQSVSPSRAPGGRGERRVVLGGFAASVAVLGLLVPVTAADPPSQPSWVDTALRALPDHTKVLDNGDWGGLLMWRYPQLDLVMHGYGDTFTDAELKRNDDLTQVQPGWDILVKQTGARYAFLAPDSALAYGLRTSQGWRVLHASKDVEMLEAPTGSGP